MLVASVLPVEGAGSRGGQLKCTGLLHICQEPNRWLWSAYIAVPFKDER